MNRKGIACVEFALVAPLLTILLLGMIEAGRAIQIQQRVVTAAREGARMVVKSDGTQEKATLAITDCLSGLPTPSIAYQQNLDANGDIDSMTVTVAIPYSQVAWFPPFYFKGNLSSKATFRNEKPK
jgi:Flp pilus assembly protein TadG